MPTCNITGTLRNSKGEALPNTTVSFLRNGVFSQIDSVIIERLASVVSDEFGDIEIDLLPGNYRGSTKDSRGMDISFSVGVPNADAADLADIINSAVLITPTLISQAVAARDAAIEAANRVDLGALDAAASAAQASTEADRAEVARDDAQGVLPDRLRRDVPTLLADTALTYTAAQPGTVIAGDIVQTRAEGSANVVVASDTTGSDVIQNANAEPVKFKVLPTAGDLRVQQITSATTGASVAALISSGVITKLDFDFVDSDTVRSFIAPDEIDYRRFRVNGAKLFNENQFGAAAELPAEFPVAPLFSAYFNSFGRVETDFDVAETYRTDVRFASVKHYYIDPINGTSGGAGTEADPMDRPSRATAAEAASPSAEDAILLHVRPAKYDQGGTPLAFPAGIVKPWGIVPWGTGGIKILQGWWGGTRTWTDQTGGVWSASVSAVNAVFDEKIKNRLGDASFYSPVESISALVPGTWRQEGSLIYVHTLDGRQPDIDIGLSREIQNNITDGLRSIEIYHENVYWFGGQTGTRMRTASLDFNIDYFTKNCRWSYASANGMELYGHRLTIHQNGVANYNLLDGFNYHSDTGTLTREGLGIEINCRGYRNGYAWSGSQNINNGTTAHDKCIMMRYGTVAFENQGPNIVDVNDVWSYNFACFARDSLRTVDSPDKADFDFADFGGSVGTFAWMDCCAATKGSSLYALTSGATTRIRRCNLHPSVFGVGRISGW